MEKHQYILKPSLKRIALTNVAIILWNQADILPSIRKFRSMGPIRDEADTLIIKVKEKVSVLLLPDSLKEELMNFISPIGLEIIRWQVHHRLLSAYDTNDLDQLSWTSQGTVDYRETAKRIIRKEQVDIIIRYRLACRNCLDDDIQTIRGKLSEDKGKSFYIEGSTFGCDYHLVTFWAHYLNGDSFMLYKLFRPKNYKSEVSQYFQFAFNIAALSGNKVATEYFFQKLISKEIKESALMDTAFCVLQGPYQDLCEYQENEFPLGNRFSVAVYLLSQMKVKKQIKIFKKYPEETLSCLLDWPRKDLFMKIAQLVWPFLPLNGYERILFNFCKSRRMSAFNYMELFEDFLLQAPRHLRNGILDDSSKCGDLISRVFSTGNRECINLVLRNVANEVKERIITTSTAICIYRNLMKKGDRCLLKLFVEEFTSSTENKIKLKNCFIDLHRQLHIKYSKCDQEKFFQLIDNANVRGCNKRSVEELEREVELALPKKVKGKAE